MQGYSEGVAGPGASESFLAALRGLHAEGYAVGDAKSTVDTLRTILGLADCNLAVAGGLPPPARLLVEAGLKGYRHSFVEDLKPGEALPVISKADVGISWARYGASRDGAVVEVVYDEAVKLVSALPRISVFLLSTTNLSPDLFSVFGLVADLLRSSSGAKPAITVISGPSKTADIELKLLYGVHGPHELHVLLLEWI